MSPASARRPSSGCRLDQAEVAHEATVVAAEAAGRTSHRPWASWRSAAAGRDRIWLCGRRALEVEQCRDAHERGGTGRGSRATRRRPTVVRARARHQPACGRPARNTIPRSCGGPRERAGRPARAARRAGATRAVRAPHGPREQPIPLRERQKGAMSSSTPSKKRRSSAMAHRAPQADRERAVSALGDARGRARRRREHEPGPSSCRRACRRARLRPSCAGDSPRGTNRRGRHGALAHGGRRGAKPGRLGQRRDAVQAPRSRSSRSQQPQTSCHVDWARRSSRLQRARRRHGSWASREA